MQLSTSWFTEPVFDFEYKKYQLLAYLQEKEKERSTHKLFPHIDELLQHVTSLEQFIRTKNEAESLFRKEFNGIDIQKKEILYKNNFSKNAGISEMMDIVHYSFEKMNECHLGFRKIHHEIKKEIQLEAVGILPIYQREGFLLIRKQSEIYVFEFALQNLLQQNGAKKINVSYLLNYKVSLANTEQSIKQKMTQDYKKVFPNPAVFSVYSSTDLPLYETLLPIACSELAEKIM